MAIFQQRCAPLVVPLLEQQLRGVQTCLWVPEIQPVGAPETRNIPDVGVAVVDRWYEMSVGVFPVGNKHPNI